MLCLLLLVRNYLHKKLYLENILEKEKKTPASPPLGLVAWWPRPNSFSQPAAQLPPPRPTPFPFPAAQSHPALFSPSSDWQPGPVPLSLMLGPRLAAGASFFHLPCSSRTLVGGNRSFPNPANIGICLPSVSTTPNKSRGSPRDTLSHPIRVIYALAAVFLGFLDLAKVESSPHRRALLLLPFGPNQAHR
jgi:hypothetical protein